MKIIRGKRKRSLSCEKVRLCVNFVLVPLQFLVKLSHSKWGYVAEVEFLNALEKSFRFLAGLFC